MTVRCMLSAQGDEQRLRSSLAREIAFASHHATHHHAMMASIALEHGVDYRELAQANRLEDPGKIRVGQTLRIPPPEEKPAVQVGAARGTGIAKARRHDRHARRVVEGVALHRQPGAQPVAGRVVPWEAGLVHAPAGRLSDDEQAGGAADAKDRPGRERQMIRAHATGARLAAHADQRLSHALIIEACRPPLPRCRRSTAGTPVLQIP